MCYAVVSLAGTGQILRAAGVVATVGKPATDIPLVALPPEVVNHCYDVLHGVLRNNALQHPPRIMSAGVVSGLAASGYIDEDAQWHTTAQQEVVSVNGARARRVSDLLVAKVAGLFTGAVCLALERLRHWDLTSCCVSRNEK